MNVSRYDNISIKLIWEREHEAGVDIWT